MNPRFALLMKVIMTYWLEKTEYNNLEGNLNDSYPICAGLVGLKHLKEFPYLVFMGPCL